MVDSELIDNEMHFENVECRIERFVKSGAEVRLSDGRLGFVPNIEFFWQRGKRPANNYCEGQTVLAVPIGRDRYDRLIFSVRRTRLAPWLAAMGRIRARGMVAEGVVVECQQDRVFVDIHHGVEAVLHRQGLPLDRFTALNAKPLNEVFSPGDAIYAAVEDINMAEAEIGISVSALADSEMVEPRDKKGPEKDARLEEPPGIKFTRRLSDLGQLLARCGDEQFQSQRVFLQVNNPELRDGLGGLLEQWGLKVLDSPDDLEGCRFDLYLVEADLEADIFDRPDRIAKVIARHPEARTVLLTADPSSKTRRRLQAIIDQLWAVLIQPVEPALLQITLRKVLDGERVDPEPVLAESEDPACGNLPCTLPN